MGKSYFVKKRGFSLSENRTERLNVCITLFLRVRAAAHLSQHCPSVCVTTRTFVGCFCRCNYSSLSWECESQQMFADSSGKRSVSAWSQTSSVIFREDGGVRHTDVRAQCKHLLFNLMKTFIYAFLFYWSKKEANSETLFFI